MQMFNRHERFARAPNKLEPMPKTRHGDVLAATAAQAQLFPGPSVGMEPLNAQDKTVQNI